MLLTVQDFRSPGVSLSGGGCHQTVCRPPTSCSLGDRSLIKNPEFSAFLLGVLCWKACCRWRCRTSGLLAYRCQGEVIKRYVVHQRHAALGIGYLSKTLSLVPFWGFILESLLSLAVQDLGSSGISLSGGGDHQAVCCPQT